MVTISAHNEDRQEAFPNKRPPDPCVVGGTLGDPKSYHCTEHVILLWHLRSTLSTVHLMASIRPNLVGAVYMKLLIELQDWKLLNLIMPLNGRYLTTSRSLKIDLRCSSSSQLCLLTLYGHPSLADHAGIQMARMYSGEEVAAICAAEDLPSHHR